MNRIKIPLGETEEQFKQYLRIMVDELNVHGVVYDGWEYTAPGWRLNNIKDKKAVFVPEKLIPPKKEE